MQRLTAARWLLRLFLGIGAAALVLVAILVVLPKTRPYVPTLLSLFRSPDAEPEISGSPDLETGPGDALLVVSHEAILEAARPGRFESALWSYAWKGLLEQEFGRPAVVDLERLSSQALSGRRVVVLTRSATLAPPGPGVLEALRGVAAEGGAVLLEMPTEAWADLSGVVLSEVVNPAARTWRGAPLEIQELPATLEGPPEPTRAGATLALLHDLPVHTWLKIGVMQDPQVRSLGRISGEPVLYVATRGRGAVLTLALDLGFQIQALQQGTPGGPGWRVPEAWGLIPGLSETQDLVAAPSMLDNPVPYADLLEGWMAGLLEDAAGPLPGWWRFPAELDGLLAVSHDEEEQGLESFGALLPWERELELESTIFVMPGPDLGERWPSSAGDLELHWNRFLQGAWPPYRALPLAEQVEQVRAVRGSPPRLSRLHYLAWGTDYAAPFRRLAAAGIELDSSYGPNRGRGYLFGTGLPFQALDVNGFPLPIREWPFVAQEDWYGVDASWVRRLLDDSSRSFHQAPGLLLHPHRWVAGPQGRRYLEEVARAARERRHGLASMAGYHAFLERRNRAVAASRRLGDRLVVDLLAPGPGLALRLPGEVQEPRLDGVAVPSRVVRLGDRRFALVAVPAGRHRLEARIGGGRAGGSMRSGNAAP